MDLVAGPQGSGKSTFFAVARRGFDSFNIDDRRKLLNRDSSQRIPASVQQQAIADCLAFIEEHIAEGRSFSIEVTLAKDVTFEQAARARRLGFTIHLTFIAADLPQCIERVANRVDLGGHGVPASVIRDTHRASLKNLARAIRSFDVVQVYDGGSHARLDEGFYEAKPRLVLEARGGTVIFVASDPPRWLPPIVEGS